MGMWDNVNVNRRGVVRESFIILGRNLVKLEKWEK